MKLWLVVPVKPFAQAKSRLATVLTPERRSSLARELLARTLEIAAGTKLFAEILVVSRDEAALTLACALGATAMRESGTDLNLALTQAGEHAERAGAEAILVLPADLPSVDAEDLRQICSLGSVDAEVVLAASQDGGTNALLVRAPRRFVFAFGRNSFAVHRRLAEEAGCRIVVYTSPAIAFDLDRPDDWEVLRQVAGDSPTLLRV